MMTQICCSNFLLLFFIFHQFLDITFAATLKVHSLENASNKSVSLGRGKFYKQGHLFGDKLLSSDSRIMGTQKGNDIELAGNGFVNLTLSSGIFQVEVCESCTGSSKICFETEEIIIDTKLQCPGLSSKCQFQVSSDDGNIVFGETSVPKGDFGGSCLKPIFKNGLVTVIGNKKFMSCNPKIDTGNIISLYVEIDLSCPIKILNAKVHGSQIPSIPLPSTKSVPSSKPKKQESAKPKASPSEAVVSTKQESSEDDIPWWGWLLIGIACALVIGIFFAIICSC